jgi:hypothetical protein
MTAPKRAEKGSSILLVVVRAWLTSHAFFLIYLVLKLRVTGAQGYPANKSLFFLVSCNCLLYYPPLSNTH